MSIKFRLCLMLFLQYAIWGSWNPLLSEYLMTQLHFTGFQVGIIYSLLPLATIISPFVGGYLADRHISAHKIIALTQSAGGVILISLSIVREYPVLFSGMLIYCLLFTPTISLTNTIVFTHLKNIDREFGSVRVWGTMGWMFAGYLISLIRMLPASYRFYPSGADMLFLAGIFSLLMGIQVLTLPDTPPQYSPGKKIKPVNIWKIVKQKHVFSFLIIGFIMSTQMMFYYILIAPFLTSENIGFPVSSVAALMTLGQLSELFVMAFFLSRALSHWGIRRTLIAGISAWALRYLILAWGKPPGLMVAALPLHGFCFTFFYSVSLIYVDRIFPKSIRSSAQSFLTILFAGIGNYAGSLFTGWIQSQFTRGGLTNWQYLFLIPSCITLVSLGALMYFFRPGPFLNKSDTQHENVWNPGQTDISADLP